MAGGRTDGSRKSMRAIPLTQRQRKQSKSAGIMSHRAQRVAPYVALRKNSDTPHARRGRAAIASPIHAAPELIPDVRPSAPLDLNAESDALQSQDIPAAPMDSVDTLDTIGLSAPPRAETHDMVMTPSPESGVLSGSPSDPEAPRRVKVRVRRKRQTPIPQSKALIVNMEMEETVILPSLRSTPKDAAPGVTLNIALDSETVLLTPPTVTPSTIETPSTRDAALDAETASLAPATDETAPEEAAPITDSASTLDEAPELEPLDATSAGAGDVSEPPQAEPAPDTPSPEEPAPEPRPAVTTRKLPTLAVMAALASRAEARAETNALEESLEKTPEGPSAAEALELAGVEEAPQTTPDTAHAVAPDPTPGSTPDFSDEKLLDETLLSDLRALIADIPAKPAPFNPPASVTRPSARGKRSVSQPLAPAAAPGDPALPGKRGMWWLNAPQPAGEERKKREAPDARDKPDARDSVSAGATAALWTATEVLPRTRPAMPAPRRAPPITRQLDRESGSMRDVSQPHRARVSSGRAGAPEEEPVTLLAWLSGGQALLCGAAAFVAAIALLNGSAGARAVTVFTWAITFALIAGGGAWLGHLAWRERRARRATLMLLLSQLGLLVWALALLGPRPALMTLVPFGVALALRGLGRPAAAIVGLAALALYALALALNVSGGWIPAVRLTTAPAAILDALLVVTGMTLTALALASLYAAGERERARTRAIERAARLATIERDTLRTQTEDDADALRRALSAALRGVPTEGVRARGALSPLAEQVSVVAERLVDLSHDREERKRLESAARRLIRNIERAWLGLSWEWPEASGVILDDLVALLRTPPPSEPTQLPEDTTPTGQAVAPHLYRAWQPGISIPSQPLTPQLSLWPDRSAPSQPSGVWQTLWPSDHEPAAPGTNPLALPPAPRWRGPNDEPRALENASYLNGVNGAHPEEMPPAPPNRHP